MKRETERKLITYTCLSIIAAIFIFGLMGCASFRDMPVEKKTLLSYETMGKVLYTAKPVLIGLCQSGTLDPAQCLEALNAYNKAVRVYKDLGDIVLIVIDTGSDATYRQKALYLMDLLFLVQTYTGEF